MKRKLEEEKGDMEWGEFLLYLYTELKKMRRERSFKRLKELIGEEELETIEEEAKKFREGFKFR